MEEYYTLAEAINYLVEKGYTFQFEQLYGLPMAFTKPHAQNHPVEDFRIDEIFCCRNLAGDTDSCFVFAVSSQTHQFKGIVMTPLTYPERRSVNYFLRRLRIKLWKNFKKYRIHAKAC